MREVSVVQIQRKQRDLYRFLWRGRALVWAKSLTCSIKARARAPYSM
jgi:hypothetical protein